eukprot:9484550-Pyramimonas_sp.AAC.1
MRLPCDSHKVTMRKPYGYVAKNQQISMRKSQDYHTKTIRLPHGSHTTTMRQLYYHHTNSIVLPWEHHYIAMRKPDYNRMRATSTTILLPCENHARTT